MKIASFLFSIINSPTQVQGATSKHSRSEAAALNDLRNQANGLYIALDQLEKDTKGKAEASAKLKITSFLSTNRSKIDSLDSLAKKSDVVDFLKLGT